MRIFAEFDAAAREVVAASVLSKEQNLIVLDNNGVRCWSPLEFAGGYRVVDAVDVRADNIFWYGVLQL